MPVLKQNQNNVGSIVLILACLHCCNCSTILIFVWRQPKHYFRNIILPVCRVLQGYLAVILSFGQSRWLSPNKKFFVITFNSYYSVTVTVLSSGWAKGDVFVQMQNSLCWAFRCFYKNPGMYYTLPNFCLAAAKTPILKHYRPCIYCTLPSQYSRCV